MKASQKGLISEILSLKRISYASLDVKRKQTYDILMHYFQRKLDFSDLCLCLQDLSPTLGIQAQLPVLLSEYEFHSKKDIEQYFTLLRSLPSYYAGICDFQKKKAKHHCFLHEETCKKIIGQCNHFIDEKTLSENILMTSFQSRINACAFLTQKEQQSYMKTNEKIIRQQIVPAYQTLADTLSSLMTAGYCNGINGLCTMKGGKDYYEYLVHDYTGCSRSVPEIKAQIQSALLTDVKHLQSLLRENSTRLNRLDSTTSSSPSDILKDLSQKMTADFSEFQNIPFQLKSVNQTLQNYLSPAFYITPPLDERSKNTIYINPAKTENLYPVLAHEGLPGHMYQNSFFSSTNPPKIRYLLDCGGYSEGWAVYAELLSYSYQFPETAVAEIHRIHSSFSLALYCLCDIGVNYEGWNYSHLKHFLSDYNITEDEVCNQMFEAVIEDPANYLKYYVGYLQVIELRDYVKNKAGSSFSLKQFHNALLSIGPADFDVVKKWILYEYFNEKKTG
ncbi:MAG: DUF885 domain-containing protein [Eubacterium sp.]|nr:DUF885 domain-containing protein [Eubacterium sp.]